MNISGWGASFRLPTPTSSWSAAAPKRAGAISIFSPPRSIRSIGRRLRAYERALRSRNALLKSPQPRPREIAAYDLPLLEHGTKLGAMRARLVERLAPLAAEAHREISGTGETLQLRFRARKWRGFRARSGRIRRRRRLRLRQTIVGPHRDDIEILVEDENGAANMPPKASSGPSRWR